MCYLLYSVYVSLNFHRSNLLLHWPLVMLIIYALFVTKMFITDEAKVKRPFLALLSSGQIE